MSTTQCILSAEQIARIAEKIGYSFQDVALLQRALTHRSVHGRHNYERLEFLGDSILNFLIGERLFQQFPTAKEGQLSRLRALLVKGETLAEVAEGLDLGGFLILGPGELRSGGQRRRSILADSLESLIGALYLDGGLERCRAQIFSWYGSRLTELKPDIEKDAKTRLQEYLQSRQLDLPSYEVVSVAGEAHDQRFTIRCTVGQMAQQTTAIASSRRKAEQKAAQSCIEALGI